MGLPSEQWGSKVAAVVVLHPDAHMTGRNGKSWGPMDMRRALKDRLAGYKIPQEMKVLDAIPRNAMGKGELYLSPPFPPLSHCFHRESATLLENALCGHANSGVQ